MTMTDELVKRIDARARQGIAATPFNLLMDAKERIEALTAERDGLLRCVTDNHVALCRAEKAEAERDRLRKAIMFWLEAEEPDVDAAINMMRAALKGDGQ